MLTRRKVDLYVGRIMPGWTVFEQANGAKGIVPCSPGYPTGCRTLGYSWPAVVRKVKQMQREADTMKWA